MASLNGGPTSATVQRPATGSRLVCALRLSVLAGLGSLVAWGYWPSLGDMANRWSYDPQYSHGYLVPFFALALLWVRRGLFGADAQWPNWWGAALLLISAGLRLVAAYVFFGWLEGLSLLIACAGVCLLVGGWGSLRWAWPAIAFLAFMVPLPFRVQVALGPALQRMATVASAYALQTVGFCAVADGNVIRMTGASIGVVEACSGLSMLITFFALSTGVALIIRRPLRDRVVVLLSAVPIALGVNIARITVTGVLHKTVGSEAANAVFHDLAGWLMMPLALALVGLELFVLSRLLIEEPRPQGPVLVSAGRSRAPAATQGLRKARPSRRMAGGKAR
jgi:exosortase